MCRSSILLIATFAVFVSNSAVSTTPQEDPLTSLIVGGQDADISDYPYQVSVRIRGQHACGGSIIADNVVLTATHCINNLALTENDYSIQYGLTNIGANRNIINVTRLVVNTNYKSGQPDYDVGLIILASDIPNAQIISLATMRPAVGTNAVVTGWGRPAQDEPASSVLQSVTVQVIPTEECQKQYSGVITITDRTFCAGVPGGGKDACQGDSGGPLVVDNQLVGVVAGGLGCGDANFYGVYSDVASLRDFILQASR